MAEIQENVFIQSPQLLTAAQRARDTFVTGVMWAFYLYLWAPLISLFAWLLGFEFAYDVMIRAGGARGLGPVLIAYGAIVGAIFFAVTAWSLLNRRRFRGRNRRRFARIVTDPELAAHFGVRNHTLHCWQRAKTLRLAFDEDGQPVALELELDEVAPDEPRAVGHDAIF